jgi:5'-nucleotidase
MGRETKILLALLGLLMGVFLGVVSVKLFVPRPPAGAGPDVHADIAMVSPQSLVEPPDLGTSPATAAEIATVPPPQSAADALPPIDPYAGRPSRFGGDALASARVRDPVVTQASFAAELPATDLLPPPTSLPPPRDPQPVAPAQAAARIELPVPAPDQSPSPGFDLPRLPAPPAPGAAYVAQPGDSWWSLAERAYGDGRLYRALFAWNRTIAPRISLAPGTRLEIPPAAQLGAAWPALLPRD